MPIESICNPVRSRLTKWLIGIAMKTCVHDLCRNQLKLASDFETDKPISRYFDEVTLIDLGPVHKEEA